MLTLGGHRGAVRAVAYRPDGRLVSAGQDGRVIVHGADGRSECINASQQPVYALAVRPDGARVVYAGRPTRGRPFTLVGQFDFAYGGPVLSLPCTVREGGREVARTVWVLSWSADGRMLAAACRRPGGGNIPTAAGGQCWTLTAENRPTNAALPADTYTARFAPTGTRLAVAQQKRVGVYDDLTKPKPAWSVPHDVFFAADLVWSPAGDQLVVAVGGFLLFADPGGRPRRVKTGLRVVTCLAVGPDGQTLLAGGSPGGVEVYHLPTGTRRTALDFGLGVVHALAVAPDGLTAAAGGASGLVVFDLESG